MPGAVGWAQEPRLCPVCGAGYSSWAPTSGVLEHRQEAMVLGPLRPELGKFLSEMWSGSACISGLESFNTICLIDVCWPSPAFPYPKISLVIRACFGLLHRPEGLEN